MKKAKNINNKVKSKKLKLVVETTQEVADFFGTGIRQVFRWKVKSMPVEEAGNYDLGKIAKWLFKVRGISEDTASELQAVELRINQLKERKLTYEADILAGKLIEKDNVFRVWGQHIAGWAAQIQAWPDSVLTEIPLESRPGVEKVLRHMVDDLGKQLYQNGVNQKIIKMGKESLDSISPTD